MHPTKRAQTDIDTLLRQEEDALTRQSAAEAWSEVRRRRDEVLSELDQALRILETRRNECEEKYRTLAHRRQRIADIDSHAPQTPPLAEMRRMKQDLHDAHVELIVFQRTHANDGRQEYGGWSEMSFSELSLLGVALFWPLVVGLLIAAAVLAIGLRLALTL